MITGLFAAVFVCVCAPVWAQQDDEMSTEDQRREERRDVVFDVYRQGDTRFGEHSVRFRRDGQEYVATNRVRLRAGLGPITVFRYEHDSEERWQDGRLRSMQGRTLKDGNVYTVTVRSVEAAFEIEGVDPEMMQFAASTTKALLTSHWRGYDEGEQRLINTEHGTFMDVDIRFIGRTQIEGDGDMINVNHFRLISDLTVELYYDMNGNWAGCEFDARGQAVRYVRRAR
jgi:hypothetical protein